MKVDFVGRGTEHEKDGERATKMCRGGILEKKDKGVFCDENRTPVAQISRVSWKWRGTVVTSKDAIRDARGWPEAPQQLLTSGGEESRNCG